MSTQTAPWIILFTPLVSAALILLLGKFSKTLSASLALIAAITGKLDADMFDVRDNLKKISTTYQKKADAASPSAALRKPKATKSAKKKTKKS